MELEFRSNGVCCLLVMWCYMFPFDLLLLFFFTRNSLLLLSQYFSQRKKKKGNGRPDIQDFAVGSAGYLLK